MERGVAAAGEGFPSHQLRSIVHQGATARASFNFRGDGLFDTVNSLAALGSRACAGSQMVHSFDPHVAGFGDVARFAVAMGIPDAAATRVVGPVTRDGVAVCLGWTGIGPRTRDMPSWMAARSRMDEADPNTLMRTSEVMDLVQTRVFRVRLSTPRRNFARNTPTKAGRSWSSAFSWMGN
jgi:hypothetical protein